MAIMSLGLLSSVVMSRNLGPTGRGEIAAVMLWPILLITIGSFGLLPATLFYSARPETKTDVVFASSTALGLFQGLMLLPIGYVILPLLLASQTSNVITIARWYLLVIPISLITQCGTSILQGRMHIAYFNYLRLFIPIGYFFGIVALTLSEKLTLANIVSLNIAFNVGALGCTLIALRHSKTELGYHVSLKLLRKLVTYGIKTQLGDLSQSANLRLDQVVMAAWLPPSLLGVYAVAVSSASLGQVVSLAARIVGTPSIVQKSTQSERVALLEALFHRYWVASIIGAVGIGVTLPFAIPFVYGHEYTGAVWPAVVLVFGGLLLGAKDVLIGGAQALGKPWLGSRAELTGLCVTIMLLIILLPTIGILGAAIASVVAYATTLAVIVHSLARSCSISIVHLFYIAPKDLNPKSILSRAKQTI